MPEAAQQQSSPYIPSGMTPLVFEQFQGINTSATRPGIKDEQMWWCDGFIPLGPQFLRTLYGVAPPLWTAPAGLSIVLFKFINIGPVPYKISILSDGSIYAVNVTTAVATQIAPAHTITNPAVGQMGINQYGAKYAMIVANQTDGYWLWDGTLFYGPGALAPIVSITNVGSGYTTATASVAGGSGGGATFTVQVSGGVVTGVTITNPGSGWAGGDVVTMTIAGGHVVLATATVLLMPRGIGGTTVETYAGHVWIGKGAVNTWSAPGSVQDFSSANGGGNYTSSDSWLRVQYTQFISTNGFLYLVGDSSLSYISGVQTGAGVTSFSLQNADPEVGTIWPNTVEVFGRNIVFANSFGAHISFGAAVTKTSEPLDGVYNTVPLASYGTLVPSSAKANIFGKKVWMFLLPIIDPISQVQTNKLFMWNGKIWWAATQDVPLTFIQTQEINSVLIAWGTNGSSVYQLFAQPSTAVNKVVQSKLWAAGGIFMVKDSGRLWVLAQYYSVGNPNVVVSIDNESGVSVQTVTLSPRAVTWHTVGGLTANWFTQGGAPVSWFIAGINAYEPKAVGQSGVLLGETLQTYCNDMALISVVIDSVIVTYRG